jgi:hypothetical protein
MQMMAGEHSRQRILERMNELPAPPVFVHSFAYSLTAPADALEYRRIFPPQDVGAVQRLGRDNVKRAKGIGD